MRRARFKKTSNGFVFPGGDTILTLTLSSHKKSLDEKTKNKLG
jgi:hypothetical protein